MIKKAELPKYSPNTKRLAEIRKTLSLEKSKMGKFFKSHGVKKIGDRTYISIENGESADIEKLTDIYLTFNKEFRKRNLSNKIELYEIIDDENYSSSLKSLDDTENDDENSRVSKSTMYQILNAENLFKKLDNHNNKKKVFNLGSVPGDAAEDINLLFDQIEVYNKAHDIKFANEEEENFEAERKLLKISSNINNLLSSLENNYNVKLFISELEIKQAGWSNVYEGEHEDPNFDEYEEEKEIPDTYQFVIEHVNYIIYYFTVANADSVNVEYSDEYSSNELSTILFQDPPITVKVKFDPKTDSWARDRTIMRSLTNELNKRTKLQNKNSNKYYYFGNRIYDDKISFSVNYKSYDF